MQRKQALIWFIHVHNACTTAKEECFLPLQWDHRAEDIWLCLQCRTFSVMLLLKGLDPSAMSGWAHMSTHARRCNSLLDFCSKSIVQQIRPNLKAIVVKLQLHCQARIGLLQPIFQSCE